ncbi:MAG: NAD-dependent epimerase/dehydratase family protein [Planctomycetota bacterium]
MRVLVTGSAGQVGSELVPHLCGLGREVACFDLAAAPTNLPQGVRWIRGDVTDPDALGAAVSGHRPEVVYHLAAILSAKGERDPHRTWRVNLDGTRNVLEAARNGDVRQVLFASTIAVFGPGLPEPVPDEVSRRPRTMYGVTKVAGEVLGEYYQRRWGLQFRGVRFPGLISAGVPGGGTTDYALWMYIDAVRHGRYECFVAAPSRVPMMYLPDGLRAMVELSDAPAESLTRCVYNIAAISPTAAEIADAVRRRVPGADIIFRPDPGRQEILDSWPHELDDTAARSEWGWRHDYDLERMSDDLLERIPGLLETLGA